MVASGASLFLAGCVSGGGQVSETFDLSVPRDIPQGRGSAAQILVPEPLALRALDTERIVVRPRPTEINYLAGAQWSDRLPKLIQTRLLQTFENSGRVRAAGRPGQGLLIDYQVVSDIRAFEFDVDAKRAVIEISVKLMNDKTGRVVATEVFRSETEADRDDAKAIAGALDTALDRQLRGILDWTLKKV